MNTRSIIIYRNGGDYMAKKRCNKITKYVSKAGRDLSKKKTSKGRKSKAGKTLNNHKKKHH